LTTSPASEIFLDLNNKESELLEVWLKKNQNIIKHHELRNKRSNLSFDQAKNEIKEKCSLNFDCKCLILGISNNFTTYKACVHCKKRLQNMYCPKCKSDQTKFQFRSVFSVSI